jgi:hypothetical protein
MYGYGNPVRYTDPSGNIPTPDDVNRGRAVYSCNCGWIDFGHANSTLALSIINLLKEENKRFPPINNGVQQDRFVISPSTEIRIWFRKETVNLQAVVPTGLDKPTKDSVALGIYRKLQERVEDTQGNAGMWFTHYSFEDLTSDQIGFYLALTHGKIVNPSQEGLEKNEIAWRDLARICGFPENRQQALLRSQQVYNSIANHPYGNPFWTLLGNTPQIFTWGTPLLCELDGMCANEPKRWPGVFESVTSSPPIRNGPWWFYIENLDGELIDTNNQHFHYLKQ